MMRSRRSAMEAMMAPAKVVLLLLLKVDVRSEFNPLKDRYLQNLRKEDCCEHRSLWNAT